LRLYRSSDAKIFFANEIAGKYPDFANSITLSNDSVAVFDKRRGLLKGDLIVFLRIM
jgi:hypothetical protein